MNAHINRGVLAKAEFQSARNFFPHNCAFYATALDSATTANDGV
jgi:hypothetical protein